MMRCVTFPVLSPRVMRRWQQLYPHATIAPDIVAFYHQLFAGTLLPREMVKQMTALVSVPHAPAHYGRAGYGLGIMGDAGYGLGIMGDAASRYGVLWGHNGSGPGYSASAFHAPELRGQRVTVCALCAIEGDGLAEQLVFDTLHLSV